MEREKKGKDREKEPRIIKLGWLELIDKAEALVGSGPRFPLIKKAVVDVEKLQEVINQMRDAAPIEIKRAIQILEMREGILNQAHLEGKRIEVVAGEDARRRIRESEIVKEAEKRAEEINKEAETRAEEIKKEARTLADSLMAEAEKEAALKRREAHQYTIEVLHQLDEQLVTVINTVRNGIETVYKQREEAAA